MMPLRRRRRRNRNAASPPFFFERLKFWFGCACFIVGIALCVTGIGATPGAGLILLGSAFFLDATADHLEFKSRDWSLAFKYTAFCFYIVASIILSIAIAGTMGLLTHTVPSLAEGGVVNTASVFGLNNSGVIVGCISLAALIGSGIVVFFSRFAGRIFRENDVDRPAVPVEANVVVPADLQGIAPEMNPPLPERDSVPQMQGVWCVTLFKESLIDTKKSDGEKQPSPHVINSIFPQPQIVDAAASIIERSGNALIAPPSSSSSIRLE